MDTNSHNKENGSRRQEQIKNLIAIGVSETDAVKIVDGSGKTRRWSSIFHYNFDTRVLILCISILTLVIASYSIYLTKHETSLLSSQTSGLEEKLENQQKDVSHLKEDYQTLIAVPVDNIPLKPSDTPTPEVTLTSSPVSTENALTGMIFLAKRVIIYPEPSEKSKGLTSFLDKGTIVQVLARSDDNQWLNVHYESDRSYYGWVKSAYVVIIPGINITTLPLTPLLTMEVTPTSTETPTGKH